MFSRGDDESKLHVDTYINDIEESYIELITLQENISKNNAIQSHIRVTREYQWPQFSSLLCNYRKHCKNPDKIDKLYPYSIILTIISQTFTLYRELMLQTYDVLDFEDKKKIFKILVLYGSFYFWQCFLIAEPYYLLQQDGELIVTTKKNENEILFSTADYNEIYSRLQNTRLNSELKFIENETKNQLLHYFKIYFLVEIKPYLALESFVEVITKIFLAYIFHKKYTHAILTLSTSKHCALTILLNYDAPMFHFLQFLSNKQLLLA